MGFLDRLFGRKKEEKMKEKQPEELDLDSSKSMLQKRIDEKFKAFLPEIEKFHSELKSRNESFETTLENLRKAVPAQKVDEQILKIATTSRESFIRKMSEISASVKKEFQQDIDSFSQYYESVKNSIKETNMETVKEYVSLDVAFKKETNDVVDRMKEIKGGVDDFDKKLSKKTENIGYLKKLLGDVKLLEEKIAQKKNVENKIEELKKELEYIEKNKINSEKELEELGKGELWNSYIQLTKDKEAVESEIRKIIEEVVSVFASINRPFKKFAKLVEDDSVNFKNKDLLKRYLESPFDAFVQDINLDVVDSALELAEKMLADKKINIDNLEENLKIISQIKSSRILHNLSRKYNEKIGQREDLKGNIENHEFVRKKKKLQESISNSIRNIDDNKKTLSYQEKSDVEIETEIKNMKENLKNKLKEI